MQRFSVSVPKKYTKDGEGKTQWNRVGTLVKFEAKDGKPESFLLELSMFPETKFGVFEDRPREERKDYGKVGNTDIDYPAPTAEEVPF